MKTISKNKPKNYRRREVAAEAVRVKSRKTETIKANKAFYNAVLTDNMYLNFAAKSKTNSK